MKFKRSTLICIVVALMLTAIVGLTSCASCDRLVTDAKSDWGDGLERTIIVYTADGKVLAKYEGKIDLAVNNGGYVKFDFEGKRYIYYNCFVESIAEL